MTKQEKLAIVIMTVIFSIPFVWAYWEFTHIKHMTPVNPIIYSHEGEQGK